MGMLRVPIALALAVVVGLGLFLGMHYLILDEGRDLDRVTDLGSIEFVRVDRDEETRLKERQKPEPPPKPERPPPPPDLEVNDPTKPRTPTPDMQMPNLNLPTNVSGGPYLGGFSAGNMNSGQEGEIIPLVRIEPQYPRRAAMRGIEGYVTVAFTILPDGSVSNPQVVDAEPRRIFDREAIRAILKWKFKPKVVNGQPVEQQATQTLTFNMERG